MPPILFGQNRTGGLTLIEKVSLSALTTSNAITLSQPRMVAGHRYLVEIEGLNFSSLPTDFSASILFNNSSTSKQALFLRYEATGGHPYAFACYIYADFVNSAQAGWSYVPAINTPVKLGIEVGMGSAYITVNGVPVWINILTSPGTVDLVHQSNAPGDPYSADKINLGSNAITATSFAIYERTNVKNIVLLGDSQTASIDFYAGLQAAENRRNAITNHGESGTKIADCLAHLSTNVQPHWQANATQNEVIIRIGVNDLVANTSASSLLTSLQSIIDTIHGYNAGWVVKVMCQTDFNNYFTNGATYASANAQRQAYNSGMASLTNCAGVIDLTTLPQFTTSDNTTYFQDALHMTTLGYTVFANNLAPYL